MHGLQCDQMGWHAQAKPFNEKAAKLGEEASKRERETEEAQSKANQNEKEIERHGSEGVSNRIETTTTSDQSEDRASPPGGRSVRKG